MLSGKELLISIIKNALSSLDNNSSNVRQMAFDNAELNSFLTNFNLPEDVLKLKDSTLNNLVINLEPEETQNEFVANIKFIKGLIEISQENGTPFTLTKNQLLTLEELRELIKRTINQNEYNMSHAKEKSTKQISEYRRILGLLQNDKIFTAEDYDVVEEIIRLETPSSIESNLDKVMTYLNESNARLIKDKYIGMKKEEKKKIPIYLNLTLVEPPKPETTILESVAEDYKPEDEINNVEISSLMSEEVEPGEDIFNFVNLKRRKPVMKLAEAEKSQKLKEIFAYLGFNFDELSDEDKSSLFLDDLENIQQFAKFLKEENRLILSKIKNTNIHCLLYILKNSSRTLIEMVLNVLENDYNIRSTSPELAKIVNTATPIFGETGCNNFMENVKIFKKYNISINIFIDKNIAFLFTDNESLVKIIKQLEEKGADIKLALEKCHFAIGTKDISKDTPNLILRNLEILEIYGFNLSDFFAEKETCYSLLNSHYLANKLDQFIEVGLNEYIHNNSQYAGNTFKTLLIKRIYYAYKNNMEIWNISNIEFGKLSEVFARLSNSSEKKFTLEDFNNYKKYLGKSRDIINEHDINIIKADYPIMELIDEGYRPAIYSDTPLTLLKRKTELIFDTQIISRPKVFRVFKLLVLDGLEEKQALLFSLIYNSVLEEKEFDFIKNVVSGMGVEIEDVELSKAA